MIAIPLIGALLFFVGLIYTVRIALNRGRMSDPHANPNDTGEPTLEPRQGGFRFLGVKDNWPGLLMMVIGALMLLLPLRL
jgi:hypothetical protein